MAISDLVASIRKSCWIFCSQEFAKNIQIDLGISLEKKPRNIKNPWPTSISPGNAMTKSWRNSGSAHLVISEVIYRIANATNGIKSNILAIALEKIPEKTLPGYRFA